MLFLFVASHYICYHQTQSTMQPTLTIHPKTAPKGAGYGHSYATGADTLCSAGCKVVELASITTTTVKQIYSNSKGKSKYLAINLF